jgi:ankyrin repeat protein
MLVARGADINCRDASKHQTIMHKAVERNDVNTAMALLQLDVELTTKDVNDNDPLDLAIILGYQILSDLIVDKLFNQETSNALATLTTATQLAEDSIKLITFDEDIVQPLGDFSISEG